MTGGMESPVVAGVDGTNECLAAIRYAVREAQRAGCGLRLVHATPDLVPMAPLMPLIGDETIEQVGYRLVNEMMQEAYDLTDGDIAVEKVVRRGSRVRVLVGAGEDSRLLVLGHRVRSLLGRALSHSTCVGVTTRARCPVVVVPADWTAATERDGVVVGIKGPEHARETLAVAFAEASARAAKLTVVHAWRLESPYDDLIPVPASDEWIRDATQMIEQTLQEWREVYRDVVVEIDVRYEHTATALVQLSERADLLVVGRHGGGALTGLILGSVVRTLIRESRCPLLVAPPETDQTLLDQPPMTADEVSPQS